MHTPCNATAEYSYCLHFVFSPVEGVVVLLDTADKDIICTLLNQLGEVLKCRNQCAYISALRDRKKWKCYTVKMKGLSSRCDRTFHYQAILCGTNQSPNTKVILFHDRT